VAEVLVLLNPLDVSRRRRTHLGDEVLLLAWVDANEPALGACERAVYVNGLPCTDRTYRTHPHDEVLVAFTPGTAAVIGAYVLQAVVSMAIGVALSVVFGSKKPSAGNTPQPSQVYGIAPPKNGVRLGQPIPVIYGSVICMPDFAAQPYTFFEGNEQYLHALLCVGLGDYDMTEMLLGPTSASTLDPGIVTPRVYLPAAHGGAFGVIEGQTRVRENVVTSPAVGGQELVALNAGGALIPSTWFWSLSGFARTASFPGGVDLSGKSTTAAKLAALPASPALGTAVFCTLGFDGSTYTSGTYTAKAYNPALPQEPGALIPPPTYSQAGQEKWLGYFSTCKPGQHGALLELDFVFPGGLYTGDASGNLANCTVALAVEAQPINDAGVNAGTLQTFAPSFTAKDNTPLRYTVSYPVPSGRYKVRAKRTTNADLKVSTADHVQWAGLKFQLDPPPVGTPVYGNVTLIAVVMKATNGVANDAASSMRFRVTRRLAPLGSGATAPTVNPADAFVDVVTAAYGGARPVNGDELDLDELTASRALWVGHDGFNAIFDQPSTVWEALTLAVQTVHAAPLPVGSRMSLIHDQVQPVRAQLFTDANIVAGSLKVTCQFDQTGTPQGLRVNYRDPRTFSPVALLDPIDAPDYVTVDLFGCTSGTVAQEHADLATARRGRQRKLIEFATELEGLNVLPGDRIGVQAGMVAWAQGARVERIAGRTLTLDNALVWTPAATHAVQLRDPQGVPVRVVGVTRGATDHELVLPADPPIEIIGAAASQEATTLSFGVQNAEVTDWTVSKVTPSGDTVTLEAANYDPAIYAAAAAFTRGGAPVDVLVEALP
jgi:hypothetical protein